MANSKDSKSLLDLSTLQSLKDLRIALVYTEWNEQIVAEQLNGFNKIASALNIRVTDKVMVPGCVEIPFACKQLWETHKKRYYVPEAIIAFGAVIQGGTPHFDYVCKAVSEGITQLNLLLPIPVIFGVLTLNNEEQAWERLGGVHGHKGEEAAITACKMIALNRKLQ
ncbi:MAG TPA: 6,7-dimethyl-8-ribityllumazine synthase [Flavipsychrobacter sp.]|jgi:6,7-dimethyl-8-ribityllumazine synthase|nr:6,7-dimethyl-8-ribityllumazine synthase [Flavipsychrobacter sp.]